MTTKVERLINLVAILSDTMRPLTQHEIVNTVPGYNLNTKATSRRTFERDKDELRNLGFDISTDEDFRKDAFLFGEAQGRVVVSVKDSDEDAFIDFMSITSVEFTYIGDVAETDIVIDDEVFFSVEEAKEIYDTVLEKKLKQVD